MFFQMYAFPLFRRSNTCPEREQDIRKMGGLVNFLPLTYSAMLIGSLSLAGFPGLSGFESKDLIFEILYSKYSIFGWSIFVLGLISAMCTSFYSTRLLLLVFFSSSTRVDKNDLKMVVDAPIRMALPIIILAILSIISGFFLKNFLVPETIFFRGSLSESIRNLDYHFVPLLIKLSPSIFAISGILMCIYYYNKDFELAFQKKLEYYEVFIVASKKFFFDGLYNFLNTKFLVTTYNFFYRSIDRGILEQFGPTGLYNISYNLANRVRPMYTGYVFHFIFYKFVISLAILFLIFIIIK